MGDVSDKRIEHQNTHFIFSNLFLENGAFYEKMWKNAVEPGRP
jgi:hypothetical protein